MYVNKFELEKSCIPVLKAGTVLKVKAKRANARYYDQKFNVHFNIKVIKY